MNKILQLLQKLFGSPKPTRSERVAVDHQAIRDARIAERNAERAERKAKLEADPAYRKAKMLDAAEQYKCDAKTIDLIGLLFDTGQEARAQKHIDAAQAKFEKENPPTRGYGF